MKNYPNFTLFIPIFISCFSLNGQTNSDQITKPDVKALQKEIHTIGIELSRINSDTFPQRINSTFLETNARLESITSTLDSLNTLSQPQPEWWAFYPNMWAEVLGGLAGAIIGALAAIWVFKKTIWHDKVKEDRRVEEERVKEAKRIEEERAKEVRRIEEERAKEARRIEDERAKENQRKEDERQKEIARKELEKRQNNSYLGTLIISALNGVITQGGYLVEHYKNIEQNPAEFFEMRFIPQQDLKRLVMLLLKEKYYHTYLDEFGNTKESVKNFRGITTSTDFLYEIFKQIKNETIKNAQRFDQERKKQYQLWFENGRMLAVEIAKQNENQLRPLSELIYVYINRKFEPADPTENVTTIQDQYVQPFKEDLLARFVDVPAARRILENLVQLTHLHSEIIAQNQHHAKLMEADVENIVKAIKTLEQSAQDIISKNTIK